jgi:Cu(I)/Ag(I) efflux system membrane fusion protein
MKKLIIMLMCAGSAMVTFGQNTKEKIKHHKMDSVKMVYQCPMHHDVTSDKPGKCPKCGMTMIAVKQAMQHQHKMEMAKEYTCPMHPDVISDKPGKCPKCGMTLVEKQKVDKKKSS